ncbi:MAG: signal peptidase II [Chloroflexota bacterium]
MKTLKAYTRLALIAGAIIALDQWTKSLVRQNIPFAQQWLPDWLGWLSPYARFVHWYNDGAAFGMFHGQGVAWVFAGLAVVVAAVIAFYYPQIESGHWWISLAMGMQMAGALGNLVDRLTLNGKVTDFISVGNFPVFNVADASITVGTAILLLGFWLMERAEARRDREPAPAMDGDSAPETLSEDGDA